MIAKRLDESTRDDYISTLIETGLTEDEAERMVEDFEMGY